MDCLHSNPVSFNDSEGDFPLIAAMMVYGFFNLVSQDLQGNVHNHGDALKAMGIGAASAAAGFGAGSALGLGGVGFLNGAATGAVGGAAGGFVGGAGNAWLGGASFGQGLGAGFKGAGLGALTGGAIGGISGGLYATKHGGNFWSGKGAVYGSEAISSIAGDPVEYSNESARSFSDKYFGKIESVDNLYADGTEGSAIWELSSDGRYGIGVNGEQYLAATVYNGIGKGSNVYLYKGAFDSKELLYLTMGHEYIHANMFAGGYVPGNWKNMSKHHSVINKWEAVQSKAWGLSSYSNYSRAAGALSHFRGTIPNYEQFWIPILKNRPW